MKKAKEKRSNAIWSVILGILSILYMYPIVMILFNSLKDERAISTNTAFKLPTAETFAGLANYVNAINAQGFLKSLGRGKLAGHDKRVQARLVDDGHFSAFS